MLHGRNGYSTETVNKEGFRIAVKRLVAELPDLMKSIGATAIAVRGKSGVSIAHAIAMFIDFDLIIVRKKNENSHGNQIERWGQGNEYEKYLIIDDFTSTGETCLQIIDEMNKGSFRKAKCVGILTYRGACDAYINLKHEGVFDPVSEMLAEFVPGTIEGKIPVYAYETNVAVRKND